MEDIVGRYIVPLGATYPRQASNCYKEKLSPIPRLIVRQEMKTHRPNYNLERKRQWACF